MEFPKHFGEDLDDIAIAAERSPEFFDIGRKLDALLKTLPIDANTHNAMTALIIDQVQAGEKAAFLQGVKVGKEFAEYDAGT